MPPGAVVNGVLRGNTDEQLGWIVQKFGGTSVGKFADKIAEDVVRYAPMAQAPNLVRILQGIESRWFVPRVVPLQKLRGRQIGRLGFRLVLM
jgi:hypothetical protein